MNKFSRSRRRFLGGAGATLTLPFLEYFSPWGNKAYAAPSSTAKILAYYVPNGMNMNDWTPILDTVEWQLSPILSPLINVKENIIVLSGLTNVPADPDGAGAHAAATASFLTCAHAFKTEGANIRNGISMDQVAADHLGSNTVFPSLQLGIEGGNNLGDCDSGYSCVYARNISWASETQPLPKMVNPQLVFNRLFGGINPQSTQSEINKRKLYRTSVIDYVLNSANQLNQKLGVSDRQKLDEYLTGLRALETKINTEKILSCQLPAEPNNTYPYEQHVEVMTDLMILAFQCDLTRIISFMLNNAASARSYDFINAPESHHDLSHHKNDPTTLEKLTAVSTWEIKQLAVLIEKLQSTADPSGLGSLLDNTTLYFSSELSDGNTHRHDDLPVLIAGGANGAFTTNRHIRYTNNEKIASLYISILQANGIDITAFGDSNTRLTGL